MWKAHCRTCNSVRKLNNKEIEKHTWEDLEYGEKHWKTWKMWKTHCRTWNVARHSEKRKKWEHTLKDLSMARKLKNVENETQTLYDLEYGKTHWIHEKGEFYSVGPGIWWENWQTSKMRHTHTVGLGKWRETVKNFKNEKYTL